MAERPRALVIDDETGSRESMAIALEKAGVEVTTFDDARNALAFLERERVGVAVCDLRMPEMDGIEFLQQVRSRNLDLAVVLVTGYGSIDSAVKAMRIGADDYLTKPVDLYEFRKRVKNLLENRSLKEEVSDLRQRLDKRYGFENIIGSSAVMESLFDQIRQVAPTRSTVLISGESGTGKELVANALHQGGPRRKERFLALNCGAIPSDILESELFGHERGAFTGAIQRKIGKFEMAHKGTLFLDEISELYPELQVKLLRVLDNRQIMRVGGGDVIEVDFRLLAATNRNLEEEVGAGRFREDLYYRLNVVNLRIAPLRERVEDIPLLADHYLKVFCQEQQLPLKRLTAEAVETLCGHPWPGNVRQLKNVLESVVIFHQGETITLADLPDPYRQAVTAGTVGPVQGSPEVPRSMEEIERQAILETLARTGGRRKEAAEVLQIGLRTLQRKIKEYRAAGYL